MSWGKISRSFGPASALQIERRECLNCGQCILLMRIEEKSYRVDLDLGKSFSNMGRFCHAELREINPDEPLICSGVTYTPEAYDVDCKELI